MSYSTVMKVLIKSTTNQCEIRERNVEIKSELGRESAIIKSGIGCVGLCKKLNQKSL